jgi:hypothetical protein
MLAAEVDAKQVMDEVVEAFRGQQITGYPPIVLQIKEWVEARYPCNDAVWTVALEDNGSVDVTLSVVPGTESNEPNG